MARLLWKELWSARWLLGLTYLGVLIVGLMGDPFFFRGHSQSNRLAWLTLPLFVLGLRAYSGEMAGNTVQFLYSRPIKWWKIWIAKLLVGLIGVVSTLLLMVLVYAIVVPDQYRPFMVEGIAHGLPLGLLEFTVFFAVGLAVSVLMPGIALSFASLVAIFAVVGVLVAAMGEIGKFVHVSHIEKLVDEMARGMFIFGAVAVFIAGVMIARRLAKLGTAERWRVEAKFLAVGLAVGVVLALLYVSLEGNASPSVMVRSVSPNGRWVVQSIQLGAKSPEKLLLVNARSGQVSQVATEQEIRLHAWSPDSTKFAYITSDVQVKVLHPGDKPSVEIIARLPWRLKKEPRPPYVRRFWMEWAPDGRRLAVSHEREPVPRKPAAVEIAVVDTRAKTLRLIEEPKVLKSMEEAFSLPADCPVLGPHGTILWPPGWDKSPAHRPEH